MESMKTMQANMLAQCRFDGGFPKPVLLPMGVLAVASNEDEHALLLKHQARLIWFTVAAAIATVPITVGICWLLT